MLPLYSIWSWHNNEIRLEADPEAEQEMLTTV